MKRLIVLTAALALLVCPLASAGPADASAAVTPEVQSSGFDLRGLGLLALGAGMVTIGRIAGRNRKARD